MGYKTESNKRTNKKNKQKLKGFIFFSTEDIFLLLLEREEEKERNINQLPPIHAQTGDCIHNIGICLDQESNPQPFSYRTMFQPTEPHWP